MVNILSEEDDRLEFALPNPTRRNDPRWVSIREVLSTGNVENLTSLAQQITTSIKGQFDAELFGKVHARLHQLWRIRERVIPIIEINHEVEDVVEIFARLNQEGKGEWAKRRERKEIGRMERKGWIKVHLCVDFETGKILEFCLTDKRVHESKVFKVMMEGVERRGEKVREVIMDGTYDRGEVWREIERMGAKGVIKVRRDEKEGGVLKGRDETIR
jgi:hypothetical protein